MEQREDVELLCEDLDVTARISNPVAENGYEQRPGPLAWMNSARVTTDPEDDAVHFVVSIDDPRGGLCFTVRRLPDGRIVFHVPVKEGFSHIPSKVIGGDGRTFVLTDDKGNPRDFSDPEPEPARTLRPYSSLECSEGESEGFCCAECWEGFVSMDADHRECTFPEEPDESTVCDGCGRDQYEE